MKKTPIPLFLVFILSGCASVPKQGSTTAELTILHWNDFHAQNVPFEVTVKDPLTGETTRFAVGGSANLAAYLSAHGRQNDNVLVMNAGDDFQGTPISSITSGWSQIELMNLLNPDAMVLGNHEFDYGSDTLRHYLGSVRFPILAANLFDSSTGRTFAPPYVVRNSGRLRVGIIGLLPPDLETLTLKGTMKKMALLNMDSALSIHIPHLKHTERVDLIVVVSHMGIHQDTLLAGRRNDIDVIIGGHSHIPLFTPLKKNRTIIVQAGTRGRYIGEILMLVDIAGDSVIQHTGRLVETRTGIHPPDPVIARTVEKYEALVATELSAVIGNLQTPWRRSWSSESNIGNWMADAFRDYAGTDIAFMNSGGIRKDMEAGPITKRDVWELSPFGNTLVTFKMTGEKLRSLMEWQAARKGEMMQVSGLSYAFDPEQPFGSMLQALQVHGMDLIADREYSIVTNNYVGGHMEALFGPASAGLVIEDLHTIDRDVLMEAIIKAAGIESGVEGRITNIRAQPTQEVRQ